MNCWERDFIYRDLRRLRREAKNCDNKGMKNDLDQEIMFLEEVLFSIGDNKEISEKYERRN
ncbi:hypothetical protein SAMN05192559_1222 [Halobacillus karajensis]|uniref:Uncharacterized protein n=1 Tax=Halobacillus karajensis TaxID=195088 RepID=A0A024P4Y1_9BACI|nr:hypothetical protein [Halobacillus karajensis]CDQ20864.1 hypothetical protein BN982_03219 [Halobacillus karajensis]CDQ23666.1 hypothetical protein BN983_01917 [Halobacillus karajensis]CDQ27144.1 hypothetical protein BN981_01398 [Halobacillus karajensis]SEI14559.1 hypothetical protein SAMN05192559_1222 [Halobacillus karajensis]